MWQNGSWTGLEPTVAELLPSDARDCMCCGAGGRPLKVYPDAHMSSHYALAASNQTPPFRALCKLCAGSLLSVDSEYPQLYNADMMRIRRQVNYVGNAVLTVLEEILTCVREGSAGTSAPTRDAPRTG
jgi:hypothetical protein